MWLCYNVKYDGISCLVFERTITVKIDDIRTKHESDRIAIVIGIIAIYIALLPLEDTLSFDIGIIIDTGGYVLLYLGGYLIMTAFCYKHDSTYSESLIRGMNLLRQRYYDIGVGILPLMFFNVMIWSFSNNAIVRTVGLIVTFLFFILLSYKEFSRKNKKYSKSKIM
jgi:hypothetical protein